jgi:hypothetical protein
MNFKTFLAVCTFLYTFETYAEIEIIDLENSEVSLSRFSYKTYNQLKDVEEANDTLLRYTSFCNFLEEAKTLADKYEVSNFFGIRLGHKHTSLTHNEVMVDNYEIWEGHQSLITRPIELTELEAATHASWILGKNGYEAFEYSHDPNVKKSFQTLVNIPELFVDFYNLTKTYNLQSLLGPAILTREWENHFNDLNPLYFLEKSYDKPSFFSVVTIENEINVNNGQSIVTAWSLQKKSVNYNCERVYYCQDSGGAFGHPRVMDHRRIK